MAVTDCMSLIHSQLPYSSKRGTDIPTKMHAYDSSDSASRVESGKGRPKRLQGAVHSVDKVTINATRGSSILPKVKLVYRRFYGRKSIKRHLHMYVTATIRC